MSIARVKAVWRRRFFMTALGTTIALSMAPVPARAGQLVGSGTLSYESYISPGLALSSDSPRNLFARCEDDPPATAVAATAPAP